MEPQLASNIETILFLAQLQENASGITISPNWFFGSIISALLVGLVFFLKRNLERFDNMLEKHDASINDHETRITVVESNEDERYSKVADMMITKLRAMGADNGKD